MFSWPWWQLRARQETIDWSVFFHPPFWAGLFCHSDQCDWDIRLNSFWLSLFRTVACFQSAWSLFLIKEIATHAWMGSLNNPIYHFHRLHSSLQFLIENADIVTSIAFLPLFFNQWHIGNWFQLFLNQRNWDSGANPFYFQLFIWFPSFRELALPFWWKTFKEVPVPSLSHFSYDLRLSHSFLLSFWSMTLRPTDELFLCPSLYMNYTLFLLWFCLLIDDIKAHLWGWSLSTFPYHSHIFIAFMSRFVKK
jgi:hypothetical protein